MKMMKHSSLLGLIGPLLFAVLLITPALATDGSTGSGTSSTSTMPTSTDEMTSSTESMTTSTESIMSTSTPAMTSSTEEMVSSTEDTIDEMTSSTESMTSSTEEVVEAAAAPPQVQLTIRYQNFIVYDDFVSLLSPTSFQYHDAGQVINTSTEAMSVLAALATADINSPAFNISNLAYFESFGSFLLNCINIASNNTEACFNWQYVVDGAYPFVGMDKFELTGGEHIHLYFGQRYQILTSGTEFKTNQVVTTTLNEYNYTTNVWEPVVSSTLLATEPIAPDFSNFPPTTHSTKITDNSGQAFFSFSSTGTEYITLPNSYFPGVTITVTSTEEVVPVNQVRLTIRHEDTVVHSSLYNLPTSTTFTYNQSISPMTTSTSRSSVLAILENASQASNDFEITDLSYFASFNSFLLNCLEFSSTTACYNWQYVVDSNYPLVGMDNYDLSGSEHVYLYFGQRYQITTDKSEYEGNESITASLKEYDFTSNTYNALTTGILGHLTSSTSVITTSTVDNLGQAIFTASTTPDTYQIGLESGSPPFVFYWPVTSFTVTSAVSSTDQTTDTNGNPGNSNNTNNSGGGTTQSNHNQLDVEKAITFLQNQQNTDGSFGNAELYNDWVAVAFGAYTGNNSALDLLKQHLLTDPSPGSLVTDSERRAMALMALGISPFNGTATNYISLIVDSYDGTQIGDDNLYNDDIFALFPLLKSGYTASDEIIQNTTSFILTSQSSNGSWSSVDLTAAAVQALSQVSSLNGVQSAIDLAKTYLQSAQLANNDGGFGTIDGTAWSMQAIAALGESQENWVQNGLTPGDYLFNQQQTDGGVREPTDTTNNRIWSTAYAIPGQLGLDWFDILQSFSAPTTNNDTNTNSNNNSGGSNPITNNVTTTTTTTSSTVEVLETTTTTRSTIDIVEDEQTEDEEIENSVGGPVEVSEEVEVGPVNELVSEEIVEPTVLITDEPIQVAETSNPVIENSEEIPGDGTELVQTTPENTEPESPLQRNARNVFRTAAALATALGGYLALRLIQTLV